MDENTNEQMNLDLSILGDSTPVEPETPAEPAQPAEPAEIVSELAESGLEEQEEIVQVVNLEDIHDGSAIELVNKVLANPNFRLSVTRKAWNGIRSRSKSKRVDGMRKQLRQSGFEVAASVTEKEDGTGRWKSAVYEGDPGAIVVLYGVEPGYGHSIRSVE